jgi:hypothetical protein
LRRALCALLIVCGGAAGCKGGKARVHRSRDAGPSVEVVDPGKSGVPLVAEKEPNDKSPQPLAMPGGVKGAIDGATDVDAYALTPSAPGTLALALATPPDADLVLELYDPAGAKIAASDNGPVGVAEGLPNVVLMPGTYKVVVREFVKKGQKPPKPRKGEKPPPDAGATRAAAAYTLEATLGPLPPDGEEREPNDTAAFAGEVKLPGSGRGFCGWRRDKDVWMVPLAGVGEDEALSVDVDGIAGVALRVAVLDGTEAVLLERQGATGEAVQLRNVAAREGEPHYYVAVTCSKGNATEKYELRVASAPVELDEETEPNDTPAQAGPLSDIPGAGGVRTGYLSRGDVDVYKLDPAAEPRALRVIVEPPESMDAILAVVDQDGKPLAGPADAAGKGKPETLQGVPVPANATVYVKLSAKPGNEASERYRLRWSAAPTEAPVPVPGVEDEP